MALALRRRKIRIAWWGLCLVTGLVYAAARVPVPPALAAQQTYSVTTTADSGAGSLRQAIIDANANSTTAASPHLISFSIAGSGVQTIALSTALPQITQPTVIDGTTQSGTTCGNMVPDAPNGANTPHTLRVEITGSIVTFAQTADGSMVKGIITGSGSGLTVNSPNTTLNVITLVHQPTVGHEWSPTTRYGFHSRLMVR